VAIRLISTGAKKFVQKEAENPPRYSLLPEGRKTAQIASHFETLYDAWTRLAEKTCALFFFYG